VPLPLTITTPPPGGCDFLTPPAYVKALIPDESRGPMRGELQQMVRATRARCACGHKGGNRSALASTGGLCIEAGAAGTGRPLNLRAAWQADRRLRCRGK